MAGPAFQLGLVCGKCDAYNPMGRERCRECGRSLELFSTDSPPPDSGAFNAGGDLPPAPPPQILEGVPEPGQIGKTRKTSSEEELMEQAKYYVCESCMTPVPTGHKFCGRCGTGVPEAALNIEAQFFSDMQDPEKARLILIRGDGMDGLSYHLKADQHIVGRSGQLEFPEDPFVSPKHANLFYRDGNLVVRDEGSVNGVYFRIRGTVEIAPGDTFIAGEQMFRLEPTPAASDAADSDGTYFYSSPKHPSSFRISQILQGGAPGMTVCARGNTIQIGREDGDLNFPVDVYMSGNHCRVEEHDGKFTLTDCDSRNGTYIRIKSERELTHGDYIFIGRKLLRVELNSN